MTIEMEHVKHIEDRLGRDPFTSAAAERALECPEIRATLLVHHHGFAVENGREDPEVSGGCGNRREPVSPAMATARDHAYARGLDMNSEPIAIPLYFEKPVRPFRGHGFQKG
jgi:hypothetical protein